MRKYLLLVIMMFLCFIGINKVDAETTTTSTKSIKITTTTRTTKDKTEKTTKAACSINDKAKINKQAFAVTASYDFGTDAYGNTIINMSVYNITGDIYVLITSSRKGDAEMRIFPGDTRGGTYTWAVPDLNEIINYTITVRSNLTGCINDYRKFILTKPMKNPFFGIDACKYAGLEEYYYCTEWISQEFDLTEEEIEEKIQNELTKFTTSFKTRCLTCEKEEMLAKAVKTFRERKSLIIKVLITLIVADIATIIILLKRIKRYEL